MSDANSGKKAELWVAIAALALMFAIVLPFVGADINGRMNKLREQGVVAAAVITLKHKEESRETQVQAGGGRLVSRQEIVQIFDLSFDALAATKFSEYVVGVPLRQSSNPLPYPYTMIVGPDVYGRYKQGDTILVTFLGDDLVYDKDSFQLYETVKAQSEFGYAIWFYIASVALLIFGLWAGLRAWRFSLQK